MELPPNAEPRGEIQFRNGCNPFRVAACSAIGLFIFFVLMAPFPLGGSSRFARMRTAALSNVKQIILATQMYSQENDGKLPLIRNWMDSTEKYTKRESVYHAFFLNPADPKPTAFYGFAFRRSLSGAKESKIPDPAEKAMIFDSIDVRKNASGELDLLPNPPRYNLSWGRANLIGFADGHARYTKPGMIVK